MKRFTTIIAITVSFLFAGASCTYKGCHTYVKDNTAKPKIESNVTDKANV